jgi:hypothetical protein
MSYLRSSLRTLRALAAPEHAARVLRASCLLALAAFGAGCGPVLYTSSIHAAEQKLELAREENARWYAPYEYYFAEAHLEQSERLAAESAYEDAIRYAKVAEDFSGRALEITRRKRLTER